MHSNVLKMWPETIAFKLKRHKIVAVGVYESAAAQVVLLALTNNCAASFIATCLDSNRFEQYQVVTMLLS